MLFKVHEAKACKKNTEGSPFSVKIQFTPIKIGTSNSLFKED